jgi:hypothetical protein
MALSSLGDAMTRILQEAMVEAIPALPMVTPLPILIIPALMVTLLPILVILVILAVLLIVLAIQLEAIIVATITAIHIVNTIKIEVEWDLVSILT